jgi:hypothetical protein
MIQSIDSSFDLRAEILSEHAISAETRLLLWRVRAIQGYIGKARVARLLQLDLVGH